MLLYCFILYFYFCIYFNIFNMVYQSKYLRQISEFIHSFFKLEPHNFTNLQKYIIQDFENLGIWFWDVLCQLGAFYHFDCALFLITCLRFQRFTFLFFSFVFFFSCMCFSFQETKCTIYIPFTQYLCIIYGTHNHFIQKKN